MTLLAQMAFGFTLAVVFLSVSDTFVSGGVCGVLTLWFNLAISGQLRSSAEGRVA